MFTISAPIAGHFVDKIGHYKVLLFALTMYTITFPFFHILDNSLTGLGACIGIAFAIAAIAEVSIYPLIASIVETTGIRNGDAIGYALNEMFIQAGYAVGNVSGRKLVDWNGLLAMGVFIASLDGIFVTASVLVLLFFVYKKTAAKKNGSETPASTDIVVV